MSGGNAHDRAMAKAIAKKATNHPVSSNSKVEKSKQLDTEISASPINALLSDSRREWREPLNRADSIGLLGILMGTLFVLIVPTVWYKVPAFALLCFGTAYFIWLSHWTYQLKKISRMVIVMVVITSLSIAVIPQFIEQWHAEHLRSELSFDAEAPGIAYPDGDHDGIKWNKAYAEIRLNVTSRSKYPVQNLNLSVWVTAKDEVIAGMVQSDPEPEGCVIRRPRVESLVPPLILRGDDGSRADVSPLMNETMSKAWPLRDHYDLLCQRILAGESVALVVGTASQSMKGSMSVPPSQFHIKGDYEMTPAEGGKRVSVDEFVSVSSLPPWK
jgi:hypothetical protein